jgi:hypothetical protein
MDRKTLRAFNADAIAALEKIAEEHNLSIRPGTHRFSDSNATLKFELMDVTASGDVLTPEAQEWKRSANRYGFQPEDLGGTFVCNGETFEIAGLKTRRPKYPVSGKNLKTGRMHKFPVASVRDIRQKGGTGRRAAIAAQKGLTPEIKQEFASLAGQLSPENLHWDGERSASEVRKARAAINLRWRELEAQAGRKVSESDAYGFHA